MRPARKTLGLTALIGITLSAGLVRAASVGAAPAAGPAPAVAKPTRPFVAVAVARGDLATGRAAMRDAEESAAGVAYAKGGDLWIWSAATGETRRITTDGEESWEWHPRFAGDDRISFLSSAGIEAVSLRDGARTVIVPASETDSIGMYAWSPDGARLAYSFMRAINEGAAYEPVVRQVDVATGRVVEAVLDALMGEGACGGFGDWEHLVSYSPDGSLLMVEYSSMGDGKTVFFLDAAGRAAGAPINAIFPRWVPGAGNVVVARDLQEQTWFRYTPATGARGATQIPDAALRVRFSPNGTRVAYDDGKARTGLSVMDLLSGETKRLGRGYAWPVWISDARLAATDTTPCLDCGENEEVWFEAGTTAELSDGGREGSLPMESTVNVDVLVR